MTISIRVDARRHRATGRRVLAAATALTAIAMQMPATAAAGPTPSPSTGSSDQATSSASRATFGIGPARGRGPDPFRAYLNYIVKPGAQLSDRIIIINFSTTKLALDVYATDAVNATSGDFGLLGQGARPHDAGAWIVVGGPGQSGRVTVPARSSVVLPIRVSVPDNAPPGDHAAGVVASVVSASTDRNGANVRLVQRVGTRVFVRVNGPLHPRLSVQRLSAHYVNNWNPIGRGQAIVTYRVSNTGNVKLGARQQVSISGLFGATARVSPKAIPLLLPGGHVDVRAVVPEVIPEFWMTASVHLTPIVPGDTDSGLQVWSASTQFWAVPWILLATIISLAITGGLWWWRKRRARRLVALAAASGGRPVAQLAGRHRA